MAISSSPKVSRRTVATVLLAGVAAIGVGVGAQNAPKPAASPAPAAAAPVPASSGNDIRIGVINPFTGPSADIGTASRNGTALAAAEINSRGGIDGRKIVLVQYDDKGDPNTGVQAAQEAISKGNLHAVVGIANNEVGVKVLPLLQKAKIPTMITSSVGSAPAMMTQYYTEPQSYVFRSQPPDYVQLQTVVAQLVADGAKSVAVFADDTPFGESSKKTLDTLLEAAGIQVAYLNRYPVGVTNMDHAAMVARKTKPDGIVILGIGYDQSALKLAMNRIGWRKDLYGMYSLSQSDYLDILGSIADGTRMAMTFSMDSKRPTAVHFLNNYFSFINSSKFTSPQSAAVGYDGMYLLALAIQQAKSLDGTKIAQSLETLEKPYYGIMRDYVKPFARGQHEAFPNTEHLFMAYAKNGQVVREPETYKNPGYNLK